MHVNILLLFKANLRLLYAVSVKTNHKCKILSFDTRSLSQTDSNVRL